MSCLANRSCIAAAIVLATIACSVDAPTAPPDTRAAATEVAAARAGATTKRTIEEFLSVQGTVCIPIEDDGCLDAPPDGPIFVTFTDPVAERQVFVDYAGLFTPYFEQATSGAISLGTTFQGSVTERPLKDGRALVHVTLRTRNALAGTIETLEGDFGSGLFPLSFGYTPAEIVAGAPPALADIQMNLKYIASAPGAPLLDLTQLLSFPEPGQEVLQLTLHATGVGELRAPSGFPEGTLGRLVVQQNGLLHTGDAKKLTDPFPVEFIKLQPLGR